MKPTIQGLIDKFESLTDDQFWVGDYINQSNPNQMCFWGHLGKKQFGSLGEIEDYIRSIQTKYLIHFISINDGKHEYNPASKELRTNSEKYFHLATPKARILAALYDIKALETPKEEKKETKYVVKYVKVAETIKQLELNQN